MLNYPHSLKNHHGRVQRKYRRSKDALIYCVLTSNDLPIASTKDFPIVGKEESMWTPSIKEILDIVGKPERANH